MLRDVGPSLTAIIIPEVSGGVRLREGYRGGTTSFGRKRPQDRREVWNKVTPAKEARKMVLRLHHRLIHSLFHSPTHSQIQPLSQGAHHLDLMFSNKDDPQSVKEARKAMLALVTRWIKDARQGAVWSPVEQDHNSGRQQKGLLKKSEEHDPLGLHSRVGEGAGGGQGVGLSLVVRAAAGGSLAVGVLVVVVAMVVGAVVGAMAVVGVAGNSGRAVYRCHGDGREGGGLHQPLQQPDVAYARVGSV